MATFMHEGRLNGPSYLRKQWGNTTDETLLRLGPEVCHDPQPTIPRRSVTFNRVWLGVKATEQTAITAHALSVLSNDGLALDSRSIWQ